MEETVIVNKSETGEITLKDLLLKLREWRKYLASKWFIIVGIGIFGGALGCTFALFMKPVYTAATIFVLEDGDKSSGLGAYAGIASMAGLDLGGGGAGQGIFQGDNIMELYKSRTMIEKTLLTPVVHNGKKELLVDTYINFKELRNKWRKKINLKDVNFESQTAGSSRTRLQDSLLGTIVEEINKSSLNVIKPDKKLSIIRAEVSATDEFFAKAFNDQIVKNVNDFYVQTKTKKSLQNISILQQKTDSVRTVMNGNIYIAASIADATPNLNVSHQAQRSAPIQRAQFNSETNKAVLSELVKSLEMSKVSLLKETPLIQVVDQPVFPLEKTKTNPVIFAFLGFVLLSLVTTAILLISRKLRKIND